MNDALGDALHKLSSFSNNPQKPSGPHQATADGEARSQSRPFPLNFKSTEISDKESDVSPVMATASVPEPAVVAVSLNVVLPAAELSTPEKITSAIQAQDRDASGMSTAPADTTTSKHTMESSFAPANRKPLRASFSQPGRFKPLQFMQEHRRQTAAVVVVICMAALWMDDQATRKNQVALDQSATASDQAMDDSLLSDFDAVEVKTLREPAEPVDSFGTNSPELTFPTAATDFSDGTQSMDSTFPQVSSANPNPASDSSLERNNPSTTNDVNPASNGSSPAVRFTGKIAPLN